MFEPRLPLLQRWIDKPHALEYKAMSKVLDDACDAVQAVYACLMRHGQRADRGRAILTAEQLLRALTTPSVQQRAVLERLGLLGLIDEDELVERIRPRFTKQPLYPRPSSKPLNGAVLPWGVAKLGIN